MEKRYMYGSMLLGLNNVHDIDELIVVDSDDADYYKKEYVNGVDTFIRSTANIERQMNFLLPYTRKMMNMYMGNYQLDADIIGQNFPLEYHILDRRDKYIELLKRAIDNREVGFIKNSAVNGGNCLKRVYHLAYTAFIMQNNSVQLTDGQKAIIQKIHDRQMAQDYLDELEKIIRGL